MVGAVEVMLLPGADPLAVAAASEAVIAWAHARQLEALHQVAWRAAGVPRPDRRGWSIRHRPRSRPRWPGPPGLPLPALIWQVRCAPNFPELLAALRAGRVDLPKAQEIALGTRELDPGDRVPLAGAAVAYAAGHTRGQLRAWLARRVAAIDPDAVQRRRKQAVRTAPRVDRPRTRRHGDPGGLPERRGGPGLLERPGRAGRERGRRAGRGPRGHVRGPADRAGTGPAGPGAGADHPGRPGTGRTRPAQPQPGRGTVRARHPHRPDTGRRVPRLPAGTRAGPLGARPRPALPLPRLPPARRCSAIWTT